MLLGFALLPVLLLVTGPLSLRLAMPSARDTLERWDWLTPCTMVLSGAGTAALLWLLAFRGDGDSSTWADADTGVRLLTVTAVVLAVGAVAVQGWAMLRLGGARSGRGPSAAMWLSGAALLALLAALIAVWLTGVVG